MHVHVVGYLMSVVVVLLDDLLPLFTGNTCC